MANKSRKQKGGRGADRRISVRAIRRDPPDLKKLSQALISLAMAQGEADAQAEHELQNKASDETKRRSA